MFRKILAATDLSEASFSAVREALTIAASTNGEVGVTHVIHTYLEALGPSGDADVNQGIELDSRLRDELGKRLDAVAGDQDITLFVDRGEAYAEIVRRAEVFGADLVVIGSRGHTALERALLGSVAERVVRYAHGPVLVVRPTDGKGVVLAATDFSDPSLPALHAGAEEAARRGARLVLLHVVDQSAEVYAAAAGGLLGAIGALPPPSLQEERRQALRITLESAIEREGVAGEALVVEGTPAAAIAEAAQKLGAELIVVGTHGRTGLARITLGSTAERVVRSAPCPVLAVRLAHK